MNSQEDPCPCQDLCPSSPKNSCSDPEKIPGKSGEEVFTLDTPGMCLMKFPLQKSILAVEFCPPDSCLDDLENNSSEKRNSLDNNSLEKENSLEKKNSPEIPVVVPELCTLEVLDLDEGTIPGDPCRSQSGISVDPCPSQPQEIGNSSQTSPRSRFRLDSCTSSVVERCLSRCQGWFRPRK